MRTISGYLGAWALGIGLALIAVQNAVATDRTILVFGDSLSAGYGIRPELGWVALLEKRLSSQGYVYEVVNASVSGETTAGGLQRLPRALALHHPAILVLELGANDGLRALPLTLTRENLRRMIELARNARTRVLLVGMRIPPNYGPRYTTDFAHMYEDLALHEDVALVPFLLRAVALDPRSLQTDGLHPNAQGEPAVLDTLWAQLEPMLKKKD